ncbi:hypothetical protein FHT72_006978 [Rhizobium sp. BK077]|uniref:hypothetical protein n=1 Tax=unclassified Rhizobium TaxID=2613769 RepID=UPI00161DB705|nr:MULTISPECIES: hypothetical protein [unclassified Rhizobium]MBB3303298.1 hypothetical protein [Rhizobium sp. BK112]MBB3372439.1 hypothetical protein [Rhizobium sp. BK077]MBB4183156.1 hypothetical protein [Rhizobium sp. BK109]
MDAPTYVALRKSALGLEDWFLELIPKDGKRGTDVRKLPPYLRRQAYRLGIRGTPREILQQLILRVDVVDDAMWELLEKFPPPLCFTLKPSPELAYGTVNDANFNGEVKRVYHGTGLAVLISYGSYMALDYFGALQVTLFHVTKLLRQRACFTLRVIWSGALFLVSTHSPIIGRNRAISMRPLRPTSRVRWGYKKNDRSLSLVQGFDPVAQFRVALVLEQQRAKQQPGDVRLVPFY